MSEAELVQLPIWGGLDESVDTLRTPPNRMRTAQNCVFPSVNTTAKRFGFVPMPGVVGGAVPNSFRRIMNCRGAPVLTDGINAFGYSPAAAGWVNHGRVSPCIATRKEISTGYARAIQADLATSSFYGQMVAYTMADANGMRVVVWTIGATAATGGGTYAQVTDIATGEAVAPAKLLSNDPVVTFSSSRPNSVRAIGNGTLLQIAFVNGSKNLILQQFDTVALTWGAPTNVPFGVDIYIDMAIDYGTTNFFLAIANLSTSDITIQKYTSAMAATFGATVAPGIHSTPAAIAVRAIDAERVWVAWSFAFSGSVSHVDMSTLNTATCATLTGPFTAISVGTNQPGTVLGIERVDATHAVVMMGRETFGIEWALCSTTANVQSNGFYTVTTASEAFRYIPLSKPFMAPNQNVYALTLMQPSLNGTGQGFGSSLVLLELGYTSQVTALPAAILAPRSAVDDLEHSPGHIAVCDISNLGDQAQTKYYTLGLSVNSSAATGLSACTFDFLHPAIHQSVTLGETSYFCGGTLMSYDGQKVTETGFVAHPPRLNLNTTSTTGGFLGQSKYHYIQLWRYRTNRGEIDVSLPPAFDVLEVNLTGSLTTTNTATVVVHYLNAATYKQDKTSVGNPVYCDIYRRYYNGSIEGQFALCGTVPNDPLTPNMNFVDGMSDTELSTNPLLYTAGSALESDAPPSIRFLCSHNQRLIGIGDEANVIWYTTTYTAGEKPRWNDALKLNIPAGDGDLIALASLDGRLFAFTTTATFVFTGDGPNDTGAGETWSEAIKQPFGLGCVDPRAICVTPLGIVVMTKKGLYLFDRSGQTQWIGERVQRSLAEFPVITSIVHYESDGYVLVAIAQSEPSVVTNATGVTLCWDYRHDCWSKWLISTDVGPELASVSAESIGGTYFAVFNGSIAGVHTPSITRYTPGVWRDGSGGTFGATWISMVIEQGWLCRDLQRFDRIARIQIAGVPQGPHNLTLVKYVDFSFTVDSTVTFASADLVGDYTEHVRTELVQQKCASCLVTIADADPGSGNGRSVDLEGILFKIRARRGEYKLLKTNQSG